MTDQLEMQPQLNVENNDNKLHETLEDLDSNTWVAPSDMQNLPTFAVSWILVLLKNDVNDVLEPRVFLTPCDNSLEWDIKDIWIRQLRTTEDKMKNWNVQRGLTRTDVKKTCAVM